MQTINIGVDGMTCGGCVSSVEKALRHQPGVETATASLESNDVTIGYDPEAIQPEQLEEAIEDAGFDVRRTN